MKTVSFQYVKIIEISTVQLIDELIKNSLFFRGGGMSFSGFGTSSQKDRSGGNTLVQLFTGRTVTCQLLLGSQSPYGDMLSKLNESPLLSLRASAHPASSLSETIPLSIPIPMSISLQSGHDFSCSRWVYTRYCHVYVTIDKVA